MYIVHGCFDWIGFHLTNTLLNNGHEVVGIDEIKTEKEEQFLLSIGRNSLFQHQRTLKSIKHYRDEQLDTIFTIKKRQVFTEDIKSVRIMDEHIERELPNEIVISLPLVYGEWMQREDKGFYYRNSYIEFDSAQFKEKAIYVEDFVDAILQIAKSQINEKRVCIKALKRSSNKQIPDQDKHTIYVRETVSVNQRLHALHEHYQLYKEFYNS